MTPTESTKWLETKLMSYFPLGRFKQPDEGEVTR